MRKLLGLLALSMIGCGGAEEGTLAIRLDAASRTEIGGFQIAVYENGCADIQAKCIADLNDSREALPVRLADGAEASAVFVPVGPLTETAPNTSTQSGAEVRVPAGRNLGLVVEALSNATPALFLGTSCTLLAEVSTGRNGAVLTQPIVLDAEPTSCSKTARVAP